MPSGVVSEQLPSPCNHDLRDGTRVLQAVSSAVCEGFADDEMAEGILWTVQSISSWSTAEYEQVLCDPQALFVADNLLEPQSELAVSQGRGESYPLVCTV